jgi:hypothetical protein
LRSEPQIETTFKPAMAISWLKDEILMISNPCCHPRASGDP